jgi:hypothetical protein
MEFQKQLAAPAPACAGAARCMQTQESIPDASRLFPLAALLIALAIVPLIDDLRGRIYWLDR